MGSGPRAGSAALATLPSRPTLRAVAPLALFALLLPRLRALGRLLRAGALLPLLRLLLLRALLLLLRALALLARRFALGLLARRRPFGLLALRALGRAIGLLLFRALRHVAVVISDDGRRHGAYGLYQGDGVARDDYPDRIVIFRDTLVRDFGRDPDALRDQVTRTVRHELAHHLGADELGVRELGL